VSRCNVLDFTMGVIMGRRSSNYLKACGVAPFSIDLVACITQKETSLAEALYNNIPRVLGTVVGVLLSRLFSSQSK
jgi:hypothetical protein